MKFVLMSLLALSLLTVTSCSSSDHDHAEEAITEMADNAGNFTLELNGTSDDSTAGPLRSIFFDYQSAELTYDAKETLEENAKWLKMSDLVDIQIEGHADERGGQQFNLALGERRARAVKNYFVALGINSSRISIVSYGKEKPLSFGHDESAWGQNRRANFMVTAK